MQIYQMKKYLFLLIWAGLFNNCDRQHPTSKMCVNTVICTSAQIPDVISDENLNERMLAVTYNANGKVIYIDGEDIGRYEFDYSLPEKIIINNDYCVFTDYAGNAARIYEMDKQGELKIDRGWTFDMRYFYEAGYLTDVELNTGRGGIHRLKYTWDKGNLKQVTGTKLYDGKSLNYKYEFSYIDYPLMQNANYLDWIYYCDNTWEINYILSIAGLLGKQNKNLTHEIFRDSQKEVQSIYTLNSNGSLKEQILSFSKRDEKWKLCYNYAQIK